MNKLTIDPNVNLETNLDIHDLYNQRLNQIIELSNEIWTDYNRHDPGITLLEVTSYLLTELSYRVDFPISDILIDGIEDNHQKQSVMDVHFPPANEVLPCAPLTEKDYRKLLIDQPDIQNAWITPALVNLFLDCKTGAITLRKPRGQKVRKLEVSGGYQVRLELAEGLSNARRRQVLQDTQNLLLSNRNLCEWFLPVKTVQYQPFILCGDIEIHPKAEPQTVFTEVMLAVHQYFQQPVTGHSANQSLQQFDWAEQVFNGPLLKHGYISDENIEKAELKTEIRLSDVINLVMGVEGVVAIRQLIVNPKGLTTPLEDKWVVPVTAGKKAVLKPSGGHLSFFKRQINIVYNREDALKQLNDKIKLLQNSQEQVVKYDIKASPGKNQSIGRYNTIQTELPEVYGLSEVGLPSGQSKQRKAQVLQLRAYLAFFDQIAENFLSQTHHIRDILSPDALQQTSYFGDIPQSITNWKDLYSDALQTNGLQQILSDTDTDLDRRNRFVDFLVARFGEDMTELTDVMLNAFGVSHQATLDYKADFHKTVSHSSLNRGLGHDTCQGKPFWNTDNISGLEYRLCKLLGIANHKRRDLSSESLDRHAKVTEAGQSKFGFTVSDRETKQVILTSNKSYETKSKARKTLKEAILSGLLPSRYSAAQVQEGVFQLNLLDGEGKVIARYQSTFTSEQEAKSTAAQLAEYLSIHYSNEGMYLIEHSLLLPHSNSDPQLPVCMECDCADCIDPYSYQIHIILPAYGARFSNMDFRYFCESVIRAEVPAHIMPRICWVDKAQMSGLAKAYKAWLEVLHGASDADVSAKKQTIINILSKLNNVYPVEQLHDCRSEQTGFVLGRTALGTLKE